MLQRRPVGVTIKGILDHLWHSVACIHQCFQYHAEKHTPVTSSCGGCTECLKHVFEQPPTACTACMHAC